MRCTPLIIVLALLLGPLDAAAAPPDNARPLIGPVDDAGDGARDDQDDRDDAPAPRARLSVALPSVALPPETPPAIRAVATADAPVGDWGTALALAYWTSPAVLAQRAAVKSSDYRIPEARAGYGLQLDYQLMAGWQRDRNNPTALQQELGQITPTTSWGWSNSAMAVLTMPLFTFGRNFAAERSATAQRAFQKQVLRQAEQQAFYDAVAAYAGLIRDRAGVTIARDNLTALDHELAGNQIRLKAHEITATDLELVMTRVEEAHAQLYAAQSAAASSEATFVQKIGLRPGATLGAPATLPLPVHTIEDAYAYAEAHSPVILAAHERERVSRAAVAAARANLMPRVDFRAQALYASQSPYDNYARYNEEIASVVITGPIFESGIRRTQIADAVAANDADWRLVDGASRDTRAAIAAAWNDWLAQKAAAVRLSSAASAAQKAYDGALIQQRAGQITTFDVLQVALEVLTVRSNANLAEATATIDVARIMAVIGALEPGAMLPGERLYDDTRHLDKVRHQDDLPLITPLLRALDGVTMPHNRPRDSRDPAEAVTTPAVVLDTTGPGVTLNP
jgi:outer membrane protein